MSPVVWMVGAGVGSWLVVSMFVESRLELLLGLVGPLLVVSSSWILAERAFRRSPGQLTSLMAASFVGKMVFFGIYVVVVLGGGSLSPVPFAVSFTAYFITLHLAEALLLRRLFAGGVRP